MNTKEIASVLIAIVKSNDLQNYIEHVQSIADKKTLWSPEKGELDIYEEIKRQLEETPLYTQIVGKFAKVFYKHEYWYFNIDSKPTEITPEYLNSTHARYQAVFIVDIDEMKFIKSRYDIINVLDEYCFRLKIKRT